VKLKLVALLKAKLTAVVVKLKTRVFELYNGEYSSLVELARAMGISSSQIYRVKHGKRAISEKFIIGALKAFPGYKLGDLFYVVPDGSDDD
jgi:transcriptional regulator with XRE-family HTH domain